jgi:hypothetical protein
MKKVLIWSRRLLALLLVLLGAAWIFADASQWLLRWRAEGMLADIQSLKVNQSTSAQGQSLLRKWSHWGEIQTYCREGTCQHFVILRHILPTILQGNPDRNAINCLPILIDFIGLRSAGVGAGFSEENGVVTEKGFSEMVHVPVRDWYLRGDAYVPDLVVSANEVHKFGDHEEYYVRPSQPFRLARYMKGPYGVIVKFKPEESTSEQAALMNFQFSCITQLVPCRSERDILPEGWQLLQEKY